MLQVAPERAQTVLPWAETLPVFGKYKLFMLISEISIYFIALSLPEQNKTVTGATNKTQQCASFPAE